MMLYAYTQSSLCYKHSKRGHFTIIQTKDLCENRTDQFAMNIKLKTNNWHRKLRFPFESFVQPRSVRTMNRLKQQITNSIHTFEHTRIQKSFVIVDVVFSLGLTRNFDKPGKLVSGIDRTSAPRKI